jgi:hypothetical protein
MVGMSGVYRFLPLKSWMNVNMDIVSHEASGLNHGESCARSSFLPAGCEDEHFDQPIKKFLLNNGEI